MINILDENNIIIFTIHDDAIFQGNSKNKLFEIVDEYKYVDSVNGGYYEYESDTGVIKSWGITLTYNITVPNVPKTQSFVVFYKFVENVPAPLIVDALGNTIAEKGEDEQGDTGVIKSWGITLNYRIIKIQNSENEYSELLLMLLALGVILIPTVSNPS